MIFGNRHELEEMVIERYKNEDLRREKEIAPEDHSKSSSHIHDDVLENILEKIWSDYDGFLVQNRDLLILCFKELHRYLMTLRESSISMRGAKVKKGNGMIYHEFNVQKYTNDLFAEEEIKASRVYFVPAIPSNEEEIEQDDEVEKPLKSRF